MGTHRDLTPWDSRGDVITRSDDVTPERDLHPDEDSKDLMHIRNLYMG